MTRPSGLERLRLLLVLLALAALNAAVAQVPSDRVQPARFGERFPAASYTNLNTEAAGTRKGFQLAEMIALGAGTTPHSPTPLTPRGFNGDGDSWWMRSMRGISVALTSR